MKKWHVTPEQLVPKLAEGDWMLNEGAIVYEVAHRHEITFWTWHQ